jgi:hypothetical protein
MEYTPSHTLIGRKRRRIRGGERGGREEDNDAFFML